MYRFRLVRIAFAGLMGFATLSPASAQTNQPFDSLPASCAEQSYVQLALDQDAGGGERSASFTDNASAGSVAYRSALNKLYEMTSLGDDLIFPALTRQPRSTLSKRAIAAAEAIYYEHLLDPATAGASGFDAGLPYDQAVRGIQYFCLSNTCTDQTDCATIDVKEIVKKVTRSLPAHRKYFRRSVQWAKREKVGSTNLAKIQRAYNKRESELRNILGRLPATLASIRTTLPS